MACNAQGAQVRLGEQAWFACPDSQTRIVVAGQYEIQVTRDGHVPVQTVVTVAPEQRVEVQPVVMSEATTPDLEAKLAGEQSPRGWGLFLIKNMVDEMNIQQDESGHTIELVIRFSEQNGE